MQANWVFKNRSDKVVLSLKSSNFTNYEIEVLPRRSAAGLAHLTGVETEFLI